MSTTTGPLPGPTPSGAERAARGRSRTDEAGRATVGDDRADHGRSPLLVLRLGDAVAIFVAVAAVSFVAADGRLDPVAVVIAPTASVVIGSWMIRRVGLWNRHDTAMRSIELSKLTRAAVILGVGALATDRVAALSIHVGQAVLSCATSWALLVAWRSAFRSWVTHHRRTGRFARRVILVGTDRRAIELTRLLATHPEAGMRVIGLIGSLCEARASGLGHLWLGDYADADGVLATTPRDGVVVCAADLSTTQLHRLMCEEHGCDRELLFHPGLSGVDARRVKTSPVAHEALLSVEAGRLSNVDLALKRIVDVVVSATLLVLASPVFAVASILIKRHDGGPVFFRQQRVGRADSEFAMFKFRTMVIDAEARLAELRRDNQRSGPLFKLGVDPRVTKVGNFLRKTSLDELPQLINVLRGEMSLVGPRPALRSEVDEFPVELRRRHRVRPGITGLWQVEARDNPAFDAYQRLDLFYVENWSLTLDIVIMIGTVEQVLVRPFISGRDREMPAPIVPSEMATAA